jgi:hypothetical protein
MTSVQQKKYLTFMDALVIEVDVDILYFGLTYVYKV